MSDIKKIGVITGGGDCGGLNAVVKGVGAMCNTQGIECYVIPNGYAGLYNLVDFEKLARLTPERLESIDPTKAGSDAGHSRVKVKKINDEKKYARIKEGLNKFDIEALVVSGGDDTGSVMVDLHNNGISCVHIPKTMDLDLQTYSVGGDSTINKISVYAEELKTTGKTHNRVIVLEVFGRYAGHTAFRGGVSADVDAILIPEIPVDFDILYKDVKTKLFDRVKKSDMHAGTYMIVVAEGLRDASGKEITDDSAGTDAFGHKKLAGAGKYVRQELNKRFENDPEIKDLMEESHLYVEDIYPTPEIRTVTPGHLVRCGRSSAMDVNFGREAGAAAVLLLKEGVTGVTIAEVKGNNIRYMPAEKAIQPRHVDLDQVKIFESMDFCFGRSPENYEPFLIEIEEEPERHM